MTREPHKKAIWGKVCQIRNPEDAGLVQIIVGSQVRFFLMPVQDGEGNFDENRSVVYHHLGKRSYVSVAGEKRDSVISAYKRRMRNGEI